MEFIKGRWYKAYTSNDWCFKYVSGDERQVKFNEYFSLDNKPKYKNGENLCSLSDLTNISEVSNDFLKDYLPKDYVFDNVSNYYFY